MSVVISIWNSLKPKTSFICGQVVMPAKFTSLSMRPSSSCSELRAQLLSQLEVFHRVQTLLSMPSKAVERRTTPLVITIDCFQLALSSYLMQKVTAVELITLTVIVVIRCGG